MPKRAPTGKPLRPRAKAAKGFEVASADGQSSLAFGAVVQADARFLLEGSGTDTLLLRRVRPILTGQLFRYYEFRLQTDFAGGKPTLLDAFANVHFIDEVQLRAGKGKVPIGLERLQSPADITFAERGWPTALAPNRDVGVQLHGSIGKGLFEYALGVYNGVPSGGSGDVDENNEKDVVGRAFSHPFAQSGIEPLKKLGFGVAGLRGTARGSLPTHRTPAQETFFTYASGAKAGGRRWLFAPQGYFYVGPFGLMGEYTRVSEEVTAGTTSARVTSDAWQAAASVVLFGGTASYQGVQVERPLDPERGTLGALEVGARLGQLRTRGAVRNDFAVRDVSANRARSWAAVLNWYFAPRIRTQVHYERTTFHLGAPNGARKAESVLVTRLQIAF